MGTFPSTDDVYDSLISSGEINFLEHVIQQPIQDIFGRIKDRNRYINKIIDCEDGVRLGTFTKESIDSTYKNYCNAILQIDYTLQTSIADTLEKLSKHT